MASADYKGIVDFAQAIDDTYVRKDAPSVPVGGAEGEVLRKKSNADGDAEWANPLYHYSTLAEMQAALALGQIPDGANVSVEEEQPGGNTGDTSLDTTSENWVQNKVVAAAVEQLSSDLTDLNYSGKTLSFSESVICPAYVSASGNYVSFVVPLNVVASKTYTVTVSDISFFKPTGGRLVWANDFDQSYKSVVKLAAGGLKIELKFSSTQSSFIQYPTVVTFSGSITVS